MIPTTLHQVKEEYVEGTAGKLFVRSWRPDGAPRAAMVIVPGFNSHSGHYLQVGQHFAALGLAVYALDLRGRGKSDGERFFVETINDYVSDVDRLMTEVRARESGLPIYLLGHSAGGVTACIYTLEHQANIAGLICESFAFRTPAPDVALTILKGLSYLAPHLHVLELKNADFSRDPDVVERLNADPLIHAEKQPTQTVAALVRADERLAEEFEKFTLPLLILHGTKDNATKYSGSELFNQRASSKDKTLKLYEGHYHDLLNDVGREEVMGDITNWLLQRLPKV
ncbi:MAG TPA: alpha/beta hydrolase [Flavobacteriales bacterium]|jgi:alpha-beta hydrolase superfamily lysophospholipase|nr:alpha/beta hydrolase [Flavobacteriales bacterium]